MGGVVDDRLDPRGALVRRGEVWWVERPQAGRRPHLILTRDTAVPVLTSPGRPGDSDDPGILTEVELGPDDGMPDRCVLSGQPRLTAKGAFVERICTLDSERMARVCRALALATGCR